MDVNYIFTNFFAADRLDLDLIEIKNFCYKQKDRDNGETFSNYGGWHSSNIDETQLPLQLLSSKIKIRATSLLDSFGMNSNCKISSMWININKENDFNIAHRHYFSTLSGVFYIQTPHNCGDLVFNNPNTIHESFIKSNDIKEYNGFNSYTWKIPPEENLLIMFPSWMEHYTLPNKNKSDRISISFNIDNY